MVNDGLKLIIYYYKLRCTKYKRINIKTKKEINQINPRTPQKNAHIFHRTNTVSTFRVIVNKFKRDSKKN